jgi:hypothetical protein
MSERARRELHHLISNRQTSFVKKRCIHDSFIYVQMVVRTLHKKKDPALFIQLDISKAFDSVNWPYLLRSCLSWVSVRNGEIGFPPSSALHLLLFCSREPLVEEFFTVGVLGRGTPSPSCHFFLPWSISTCCSRKLRRRVCLENLS